MECRLLLGCFMMRGCVHYYYDSSDSRFMSRARLHDVFYDKLVLATVCGCGRGSHSYLIVGGDNIRVVSFHDFVLLDGVHLSQDDILVFFQRHETIHREKKKKNQSSRILLAVLVLHYKHTPADCANLWLFRNIH